MLARRRALSYIAVLATMGCNLDNDGDAPPRGSLYFPNAIALSAHDASTPASHLLVANSNFDLRYRSGSVQSFSLDAIASQLALPGRASGPENIIEASSAFVEEAAIGSFSSAMAPSSDGSVLFVATRTDDTLSMVGLAAGGRVSSCNGTACNARVAADAAQRSKPLVWPGNPVGVIAGPLSHWSGPERSISGDYVLVAHRTGAVSLFVYRPGAVGDAPGDLVLLDVLEGLPQVLTEMAYDPGSGLVHLSVAGTSGVKLLARVGVAIPAPTPGAASVEPAFTARLYDAGVVELQGTSTGNDSRDLAFVRAVPTAGAALAGDRALILSSYPSALLVVDVDPTRNQPSAARVERSIALGVGAQRIVTGTLGGRPFAIVACFDARQLFVIDLNTMIVRSVVPNLSGPFDLAIDEARRLLYLTDFRSSVIRVVDLAPAADASTDSAKPVRVVATLGRPQVLPELQ
jgi:hypothetical protein